MVRYICIYRFGHSFIQGSLASCLLCSSTGLRSTSVNSSNTCYSACLARLRGSAQLDRDSNGPGTA